MTHTVTLCTTCALGRSTFRQTLAEALPDYTLQTVECMSGCTRPSTIAFRAPGKTAYLFGDLTEADLPDLQTFASLYRASDSGDLADARPLGTLRTKAIARIPA